MYHSLDEIWRGFTKNVYFGANGLPRLFAGTCYLPALSALPPLLALRALARGRSPYRRMRIGLPGFGSRPSKSCALLGLLSAAASPRPGAASWRRAPSTSARRGSMPSTEDEHRTDRPPGACAGARRVDAGTEERAHRRRASVRSSGRPTPKALAGARDARAAPPRVRWRLLRSELR